MKTTLGIYGIEIIILQKISDVFRHGNSFSLNLVLNEENLYLIITIEENFDFIC